MRHALFHKGFVGSIKFSEADGVYHGKIITRDLVTYESNTLEGLNAAFKAAVEDYIATCKERGVFLPDWYSSPGETILDLLEERGWSVETWAESMGIPTAQAKAIVDGTQEIDSDLAIKLSYNFGNSSSFWMERERQYREKLSEVKG